MVSQSEQLGEESKRGDGYGVGAGAAVSGDVRGVADDLEGVGCAGETLEMGR